MSMKVFVAITLATSLVAGCNWTEIIAAGTWLTFPVMVVFPIWTLFDAKATIFLTALFTIVSLKTNAAILTKIAKIAIKVDRTLAVAVFVPKVVS